MWARRLLGILLVAMAAGKTSDLHGYFEALGAFRAFGEAARPFVGGAFVVLELGGGVLLLGGGRPARLGAIAAVVVSVGYAALTTQAFARGLTVDNCTCFGVHLQQRLSWWVLVQDGYMLAWSAVVTWRAWRGDGARRPTPRSPAGSPARSGSSR